MTCTHGADFGYMFFLYVHDFRRSSVKVGDTIKITRLDDPYDYTYVDRTGVVEHIDSMGQLHGTWGGLAVIPGEDGFTILKRAES